MSGCGPHDLAIHRASDAHRPAGAVEGTVSRVTHLGFEVKVDVDLSGGGDCWVQLSRGTAADLGLEPGQRVWVAETEPAPHERADADADARPQSLPSLSA